MAGDRVQRPWAAVVGSIGTSLVAVAFGHAGVVADMLLVVPRCMLDRGRESMGES